MRLQVKRFEHRYRCTIGHLFIDGVDTKYFTLEDKDREQHGSPVDLWKIPGETAIPRGVYKIEMRLSSKFRKDMPYLVGVPGFEGVMLHAGNSVDDTEGCILIGEFWDGSDRLINSRVAFEDIRTRIMDARKRKETIEIHIA